MKYISVIILGCLALIPPVSSEPLSHKPGDWYWSAHICKNVAINLRMMILLEEKFGRQAFDDQQENLKKSIADSVIKHEKVIQFTEVDGEMIADMVFAARKGILESDGKLDANSAINRGFNICTGILKDFKDDAG